MSKILLIETTGTTCSAAYAESGALVSEYNIYGRNLHDKLLADIIRRLLSDADCTPESLDAIAISAGPGSYTGLRIGGALAKAMCFDGKVKLIALPTLTAIAYSARNQVLETGMSKIVSIVPSHKDLLYYQEFSSSAEPLSDVIISSTDEFNDLSLGEFMLAGLFPEGIRQGKQFTAMNQLTAGTLCGLAFAMYDEQKFTPADDFEPLYVAEFEPKIKSRL